MSDINSDILAAAGLTGPWHVVYGYDGIEARCRVEVWKLSGHGILKAGPIYPTGFETDAELVELLVQLRRSLEDEGPS